MLDSKIAAKMARRLRKGPVIDPSARVSPEAVLLGEVRLGPRVSVWPGVVLRADLGSIEIGEGTNLQDGVIVHLADRLGVEVGEDCTVGHGAILHACRVGARCLVGMRATVLDGAVIGEESLIGAHSLVTGGTRIPPGSLVLGSPAKVVRELTSGERANLGAMAAKYREVAEVYAQSLPEAWRMKARSPALKKARKRPASADE
jgi:carbonic anhydrase/acetyltransferase-like protein (isoleucine patch superfamily)